MASEGALQRKAAEAGSVAVHREGETPPDILLTVLLVLVGRRWRSLLDEKLRPTGQSSARMEALSAIRNSPPRSAQVEIAKRLRIEGPTLTRMIDTLEKDGLVARLPDPADRRSKLLQLTPAGDQALQEIFDLADVYRTRLLEGIDDGDKVALARILGGLLERLDEGLAGDGSGQPA
ncbi:MarR family winged helix-turn-helix transcriptional regulator [Croceibacterium aestuarii]|uniref:MarR family winged helix-turn-helix transcriptional regulator n=1 Tax=Croceibacterium aestuarii TaxID=3064139 RepID=UPI00272E55F4|nr:MarR family transcriptional regulator [Croceibacterium sp. D39]